MALVFLPLAYFTSPHVSISLYFAAGDKIPLLVAE